jgi:predicted secreted protein
MTISAGIVLFAVIWFMVFFVVLPLRMVTQGDTGVVVPGTPRSAPADVQIGRKARITTVWAIGVWCIIAGIIVSGVISVRDIDWFHRMNPEVIEVPVSGQ